MTAETLLEQFGYLAVFVGTFLEGEAILIAAAFFASVEILEVRTVLLTAFVGSYCGYVWWFWLGRRYGVKLLDRYPRMARHVGHGMRVFERYGPGAIFFTQWLYGIRITCAVILGMSRIPVLKFLTYQALSCALWATVITAAGFYFGEAMESVLGRVEHLEKYGLVLILAVAFAFWLYHRRKEKREEAGL
jgi:membrane protein DedA with SNARE-associated domain